MYDKIAVRNFSNGQYDESLCALRAAYRINPLPRFLYNSARAHQMAARPKEAVEMYTRFLKVAPLDHPDREDAARHRVDQRKLLRCPDGSVMPETDICPAQLCFDGSPKPQGGACPPGPEKRPVYKQWWFWTTIAGVAVGATVTGLAVGLSNRPQSSAIPDGVSIYSPTF